MDAPAQPSTAPKKPRLALVIATCFGLGYIPKAPGTAGSLAGIVLALFPVICLLALPGSYGVAGIGFEYPQLNLGRSITIPVDPFIALQALAALLVALLGSITAGIAARHFDKHDPQVVVVDEVSGQHLALLLGGFFPMPNGDWLALWSQHPLALTGLTALNWKYLLLGFILFRVFDIWKPFPVRQAEKLPGGWGIMADDWVAGIYAALGLWLARALGL